MMGHAHGEHGARRPRSRCRARTVPPWTSTRWRTMARPRPRPPCARVLEPSACRNRSKTWGRNVARDARGPCPGPGSPRGVGAAQAQLHAAAARRELDGVGEQVPDDLLQAVGVAGDGHGRRLQDRLEAARPWRRRTAARCRAAAAIVEASSRGRTLEAQLARHDARHVEDVRDELGLDARVAVDGLDGAGGGAASSSPVRSMCVQPTIAFSGVRSSWDSVARNSSLARLAARASS